ncbi:MAG TPA: glycoside hydrolase family 2 TIM barrel-domain containing protein [Planctomycetota bacterium]|nr:glycoside hydrolase family 2 TIM barrel-domain containing protein [Planctomycetota bacterium]
MTSIPRPEYPRPQFVRNEWLNLNGEWQFEFDFGDSGKERGILDRDLKQKITVPFCPESELSGIGYTDFINACWYRKTIALPKAWAGKNVLLHFQASDYDTTVWANGTEVGRHRGGFTPFSCDLSSVAQPGDTVTIVVRARDDSRKQQPCGKQSMRYGNFGCHYTRTTGIWQTVWLEPVPEVALKRPRLTPDLANGTIRLEQPITQNRPGLQLRATLKSNGQVVARAQCRADLDLAPRLDLNIPEQHRRVWSIDDPHLYDVALDLVDATGKVIDSATSYAGLRSVSIDGKAVKINGKAVFQRLVLDQGFYPDGILTAPNDEALIADIKLSMEAGFNGARLHQKVFEERFLYHADKLGYLCWGEFPDWGSNVGGPAGNNQQHTISYVTEWLEAIERDYSHPSIVGWCPLNETWQEITDNITKLDEITRAMFLATKAMDTSRPVLDASGYSHRVPESDISDCHDYEQNPEKFKANQAGLSDGKPFHNGNGKWDVPYRGQPFFVSEFGGIWWNPEAKAGEDSWGYGDRVKSIDEFYARFEGLCAVLLEDKNMFGYCYTQLTDVYQEQNGIFTFTRGKKFDMARIRKAQTKVAAIERAHGS